MMGKTHVSVGIAVAVFASQADDVSGCLVAIIGGSIGGLIPDIEVRSNHRCGDALYARLIAAAIVAIAIATDVAIGGRITDYMRETQVWVITTGALIFALTAIFSSFRSRHRGFSHSIAALTLFTAGLALACFPLTLTFAAGFVSHVLLDLLNKRRVQILYPLKFGSFCLGFCYAGKSANTVLMYVGAAASITGIGLAVV